EMTRVIAATSREREYEKTRAPPRDPERNRAKHPAIHAATLAPSTRADRSARCILGNGDHVTATRFRLSTLVVLLASCTSLPVACAPSAERRARTAAAPPTSARPHAVSASIAPSPADSAAHSDSVSSQPTARLDFVEDDYERARAA